MINNNTSQYPALVQGVSLIGIGKHGSKNLSEQLIIKITEELIQKKAPSILVGAFIGALMMKDLMPYYEKLEMAIGKGSITDVSVMYNNLFSDTPENMKLIGVKLLSKQILNQEEAQKLGLFLFSDHSGECFRGMAASVLRIRYESEEEYKGLYESIVIVSPKKENVLEKITIQFAEPFDGVEHSYMITPIIANEFQKEGHNVVITCGRSSGPKFKLNSRDLYKSLDGYFIKEVEEIEQINTLYGFAVDQKTFYPKLDNWVDKRRVIMKRPFLATLEKILNPVNANILITSVFHITYMEKMVDLGFMSGFDGVIVLKRGKEGSLSPSRAKATGILCARKLTDGSVITKSFDTNTNNYIEYKTEKDNVVEDLDVKINARLIKQFIEEGSTNDIDFDMTAKIGINIFKEGLNWVLNTK